MENATFDDLDDSLVPTDLTTDNFVSNQELENLLQQTELPTVVEGDVSLSPCMLSSSLSRIDTQVSSPASEVLLHQSDQQEPVNNRASDMSLPREVFLITYSQADVLKANDRTKFAEIICSEFNRVDNVVDKWVVSAEIHREGGFHYHLALKLKKQRRCSQVRNNIKRRHGIDLDFQGWHDNYYSAYTYVTKYDPHFMTSPNHPVLTNHPTTSKATASKRQLAFNSAEESRHPKPKKQYKPPRLTNDKVAAIIRTNNLRSCKELYAFAKTQANEGKFDLQSFLYNKPNRKQLADLVATVWAIESAETEITRSNKTRMEILEEAKTEPCATDAEGRNCEGSWYEAALETLSKNNIDKEEFASLIKANLTYGRGKGRNIMICGPTNCAKSFLLLPLTKIYDCFMTPSQGSYNWVDAPQKEVIFLNDVRYDVDGEKRVMPWNMFLNLLEGVPVNISMPKNFYAKDFEWVERQPIFATSDKPIIRIRNGQLDVGETQQMEQRWSILRFHHQYLGENVNYDLVPCGSCFAKLILGE